MNIIDLGLIDYSSSYDLQKKLLEQRKKDEVPDTLFVLEHPSVITIGRRGSYENLLVDKEILKDKAIMLFKIDRGGDITFHGPGQIVLYPILNIKARSMDLIKYIRALEEVLTKFLAGYGVRAERVNGASGIWVQDKKIGSIGIGVSRWVSFHGLSVNINTDLSIFSMIRSCGINGVEITSLANILNHEIDLDQAKLDLISSFESVFESDDCCTEVSSVAQKETH